MIPKTHHNSNTTIQYPISTQHLPPPPNSLQSHRHKMKYRNPAIRLHAARMLSAKNATELEHARVCPITSVIRIVVAGRNVSPIMIVRVWRPVWITNASIHVLAFVVQMPNATWSIMHRNAHALQVSPEIHWPAAMNHLSLPVRSPSPWIIYFIHSNTFNYFSSTSGNLNRKWIISTWWTWEPMRTQSLRPI